MCGTYFIDEVNRLSQELQRDYSDVNVITDTQKISQDHFERKLTKARDGQVGGACTLTYIGDHLLLIRDRDTPNVWSAPGGKREADESFTQTAKRETYEETGVECRITGLAYIWRPILKNEQTGESLYRIWPFFESNSDDINFSIQKSEIIEAKLFSQLPEEVHYVLNDAEYSITK